MQPQRCSASRRSWRPPRRYARPATTPPPLPAAALNSLLDQARTARAIRLGRRLPAARSGVSLQRERRRRAARASELGDRAGLLSLSGPHPRREHRAGMCRSGHRNFRPASSSRTTTSASRSSITTPWSRRYPITRASGGVVPLTVTYQGCAEAGLCYPPITRTVSIQLPASGASSGGGAASGVGAAAAASAVAQRRERIPYLCVRAGPARDTDSLGQHAGGARHLLWTRAAARLHALRAADGADSLWPDCRRRPPGQRRDGRLRSR